MNAYFFERQTDGRNPAGVTVSKAEKLPGGDFQLTEFTWPDCTLWFLDDDDFTEDEREACRVYVLDNPAFGRLAK